MLGAYLGVGNWLEYSQGQMQNSWGSESIPGLEIFSKDLGSMLIMLNLYEPYMDQVPF